MIKENDMNESISHIVSYQFKKILPLISSILLVLFIYIPLSVPLLKYLRPDVAMVCVYFWTLYRRDLFGPISVALLGFVADCFTTLPLGINMFIFIFTYIMSITYGRFVNTKVFAVGWTGFSVISFIAFFAKWLLISFYYSQFLYFIGILASYTSTVLLYPLVVRLNVFVQNKLISNEEVVYEQG